MSKPLFPKSEIPERETSNLKLVSKDIEELSTHLKDFVPLAVKRYRNAYKFLDSQRFFAARGKPGLGGGNTFLAGFPYGNYGFVVDKEFGTSGNDFLHYKLVKNGMVIAQFTLLENQKGFSVYHRYVHPSLRELGYGKLMLDFAEGFIKEYFNGKSQVNMDIELGQISVRQWAGKNGFHPHERDQAVSEEYSRVEKGESGDHVVGPGSYVFPAVVPKSRYYDLESWHPERINFALSLRLNMRKIID